MLNLWEHFKTKMKKIGILERMLHCVKIDKFKKMTLYIFRRILVISGDIVVNFLRILSTKSTISQKTKNRKYQKTVISYVSEHCAYFWTKNLDLSDIIYILFLSYPKT